MSPLDEMTERAREALRSETPEERVGAIWSGIERRRGARRRLDLPKLALVGVAAAAILAYAIWPRDTGPLAMASGEALPRSIAVNTTQHFSDGSRIDAEGRVDTLSNIDGEVVFALRSGGAHFDIVPNGPRRWKVLAGSVEVVVVGTVFDVERTGDDVQVRVERGVVLVRGEHVQDGVQRLEAGDSLRASPRPDDEAPREASALVQERDGESAQDRLLPVPENERPRAPAPSLREPVAEEEPTFDAWLQRADDARQRGEHARAVRFLAHASSNFPDEARAALASFTQGRLELESLRRPAAAARSFGRSLALGLPAPLRETAEALRVEALASAGDARAPREAERFAQRYPGSQYAARVRAALAARNEPAQAEAPQDEGAPDEAVAPVHAEPPAEPPPSLDLESEDPAAP